MWTMKLLKKNFLLSLFSISLNCSLFRHNMGKFFSKKKYCLIFTWNIIFHMRKSCQKLIFDWTKAFFVKWNMHVFAIQDGRIDHSLHFSNMHNIRSSYWNLSFSGNGFSKEAWEIVWSSFFSYLRLNFFVKIWKNMYLVISLVVRFQMWKVSSFHISSCHLLRLRAYRFFMQTNALVVLCAADWWRQNARIYVDKSIHILLNAGTKLGMFL